MTQPPNPPADPPSIPPPPKNPTHPPDGRPPTKPPRRGLSSGTGSPWPSRPGGPSGPGGPTGPGRESDADLLARIDDTLIGLLAIAYFGPAGQGTAASVEQACAGEVLLFRLRLARRAVAELRAALESPARQSPQVCTSGGPVNVPGSKLRGPGEEGCADGAVSAAFRLPDTRLPLRFGEGEHRLIGTATLPAGRPS